LLSTLRIVSYVTTPFDVFGVQVNFGQALQNVTS
jgi:hypothetical protein